MRARHVQIKSREPTTSRTQIADIPKAYVVSSPADPKPKTLQIAATCLLLYVCCLRAKSGHSEVKPAHYCHCKAWITTRGGKSKHVELRFFNSIVIMPPDVRQVCAPNSEDKSYRDAFLQFDVTETKTNSAHNGE